MPWDCDALTSIDAGVRVEIYIYTVAAIRYKAVRSCSARPGQCDVLARSCCQHAVILVSVQDLLYAGISTECCSAILH